MKELRIQMKFSSSNSNNNNGASSNSFVNKKDSISSAKNSTNPPMKISESGFTNQQLQILGPKQVLQQKMRDLDTVVSLSP